MNQRSVLLVDSDDASAVPLLQELRGHGFPVAQRVGSGLEVPVAAAALRPRLVVFNHHVARPEGLLACCAARLAAPDAVIVAIASAGPSVRQLRQWMADAGHVDAVLEKPQPPGRLRTQLAELAAKADAERALQQRTQRMARLLPDGALEALESDAVAQEEMVEAAVLFTDVRRSSELINRIAARDYFRRLNHSLSAQAACVRVGQGGVVKYTGDGLMAIFRGMGRSHLALRCARELAGTPQEGMPFGIGVAEGLVLCGFVGASNDAQQRSQYDVIGATVHLAARLCGLAAEAEVVCTRDVLDASRLHVPHARHQPAVQVRGFDHAVACAAFRREAQADT